MRSARQWKDFYARERRELGDEGLGPLFDEAEPLAHALAGAAGVIFPHTRLAVSGALPAAAALAAVRAGTEEVLAIGVLHGARERDADAVRRARAGDAAARAALRRVHGPGAPPAPARRATPGTRTRSSRSTTSPRSSRPRPGARGGPPRG